MGYSPWAHKESDATNTFTFNTFLGGPVVETPPRSHCRVRGVDSWWEYMPCGAAKNKKSDQAPPRPNTL